jgi:hypothetical protein
MATAKQDTMTNTRNNVERMKAALIKGGEEKVTTYSSNGKQFIAVGNFQRTDFASLIKLAKGGFPCFGR